MLGPTWWCARPSATSRPRSWPWLRKPLLPAVLPSQSISRKQLLLLPGPLLQPSCLALPHPALQAQPSPNLILRHYRGFNLITVYSQRLSGRLRIQGRVSLPNLLFPAGVDHLAVLPKQQMLCYVFSVQNVSTSKHLSCPILSKKAFLIIPAKHDPSLFLQSIAICTIHPLAI